MNLKIRIIVISFAFFTNVGFVLAQDYLRVGFSGSAASKPEEKSELNGNPLLNPNTGGSFIGGGQAHLLGGLYLYGDFQYEIRSAKAEYQFFDPGLSQTFLASGLKALNPTISSKAGMRFRFLSVFYIGGGYMAGNLALHYNEEKYKEINNGSDQGLKLRESHYLWGPYWEIGLMFVGAKSGIGFTVRRTQLRTEIFETLGNKRLNFEKNEIIVDFIKAYPSIFK